MKDDKSLLFHTKCFACGKTNSFGLQLNFKDGENGCTCDVSIPQHFQSYEGVVHGGIIATMLDAAMVHSLREKGGDAPVTCRLEIRYLHTVPPDKKITVKAFRKGKRGRVMLADAEIVCINQCYARARGAFTFT